MGGLPSNRCKNGSKASFIVFEIFLGTFHVATQNRFCKTESKKEMRDNFLGTETKSKGKLLEI